MSRCFPVTTSELANVLRTAGSKREPKEVTKRYSRVFQALRIEVNAELSELEARIGEIEKERDALKGEQVSNLDKLLANPELLADPHVKARLKEALEQAKAVPEMHGDGDMAA